MREFEQALNRARTLIGGGRATATAEAEPRITGTAASLPPEAAAMAQAHTPRDIPLLNADFDRFRDNFGSGALNARSVDSAFRILRTQVLTAMKEKNARVLGITSPSPGAGKTVTAIHLAMACARRPEQDVVLCDFDFRRPAVSQYLDASGYPSTVGFFNGDGQVEDYMTRNEAGNLRFFLTDRATEMSAEFLASQRMDEALAFMTRRRDSIVVADLPPLVGCDDTLAILSKLDGIIMVVASGESGFADVERSISQLPMDKVIATVLNKAEGMPTYYDYAY